MIRHILDGPSIIKLIKTWSRRKTTTLFVVIFGVTLVAIRIKQKKTSSCLDNLISKQGDNLNIKTCI